QDREQGSGSPRQGQGGRRRRHRRPRAAGRGCRRPGGREGQAGRRAPQGRPPRRRRRHAGRLPLIRHPGTDRTGPRARRSVPCSPTTLPEDPVVTTTLDTATQQPFTSRGPLSDAVLRRLTGTERDRALDALARSAVAGTADVVRDDDIQLALFTLYASAYGSIPALAADLEWDPALIETRLLLEAGLEHAVRAAVPVPELPPPTGDAVARALFQLTSDDTGPSLSRYLAKRATAEQVREFFVQRSIYTLREADPHSWAIPRLSGRAKAALVEIQADEYGGGRPDRMHAAIFAKAMRAVGLDDTYGAYVDDVPAVTLAS